MELGWCDFCLRVANVKASREFYERLGFRQVEGKDEEGWAVVINDSARLGLFEEKHLGERPFTINFRGANIGALVGALVVNGFSFHGEPKFSEDGSGSARILDPDGNLIFFDSAPGETQAR
ncbi:MAG: hypothetical protein U0R49_03215 [Fimbriimonadales bacterium]